MQKKSAAISAVTSANTTFLRVANNDACHPIGGLGTPKGNELKTLLALVAALGIVGGSSIANAAPNKANSSSTLPAPAKSRTLVAGSTLPTPTNEAGSASDALIGVVVTADYVLAPEDQIAITSASHKEIVLNSALIPTDGKINLPLLGQFSVLGKTIGQLEKEIGLRMERDGFRRPMVTVTLTTPRRQRVFVLNAGGGAGTVEIRPGMRISDVLALAGGVGNVRPELTDASLSRLGSSKLITLDLPAILRDSNGQENLLVQNGDTLRLAPRTIQISVAGSVARSGPTDVPIGSSLTEVMALVGGPTEKAALSRTTLKRATDGAVIPINLHDVLVKGKPAPEIELREGDLLLVPEAKEQVTIQGAISRPGYFPIEDGRILRISELMALAGGPREDASLKRTTVQHADGSIDTIDVYSVLTLGDETNNIILQPDDIVTVPAYKEQYAIAGTGVRGGGFFGIEEGITTHVLDALTKAGGVLDPEGVRIVITRGLPGTVPTLASSATTTAPTTITVDAVKLYRENDPQANIPLKNGDLIMVTAVPRTVYLSGYVMRPGAVELKEGLGLVELLAQAGGVHEEGLGSGVIVERNGQKHTVDVFRALTYGEAVNFPLQAGDNIIVPENLNRVAIMPGVRRPGYVIIPEDKPLSLAEAMVEAGGPIDTTKLDNIVLLRPEADGTMSRRATPLKSDKQWVEASKIMLKPGDIVFVPEREPRKPNVAQRLLGQVFPFVRAFGIPFP